MKNKMDPHITALSQTNLKLSSRIVELETAIRRHRDDRGHERCWLNDIELYKVLGEPLPSGPALPPRDEFLRACAKYYAGQTGSDSTTHETPEWPELKRQWKTLPAAEPEVKNSQWQTDPSENDSCRHPLDMG